MKLYEERCIMGYVWLIIVVVMSRGMQAQIYPGFYGSSCPSVEHIVRESVSKKLAHNLFAGPAILRLFFHDCFVTGCDASVMVSSVDGDAERDASLNLSLQEAGFDAIVEAKEAVEAFCPGIVSCADVMAIAARDAVVLMGGPSFDVELGRKDGMISKASLVAGNLPEASNNFGQLVNIFARNNISVTEMVALIGGGHSVGVSHCNSFSDRIWKGDRSLNLLYSLALRAVCSGHLSPYIVVPMDLITPITVDNRYFFNLLRGKGLFSSDAALLTDSHSAATVKVFAEDPLAFYQAFAFSMVKLGRIGIFTEMHGTTRRNCKDMHS